MRKGVASLIAFAILSFLETAAPPNLAASARTLLWNSFIMGSMLLSKEYLAFDKRGKEKEWGTLEPPTVTLRVTFYLS
jgi:hypothetical protein